MSTFQGVASVIFAVRDAERATKWYSDALGQEPNVSSPYYVGFQVGSFQLGLDPNAPLATGTTGGSIAYWSVNGAGTVYARLLELGATPHKELQDIGGGMQVAAVIDPWGNLLGVIDAPQSGE